MHDCLGDHAVDALGAVDGLRHPQIRGQAAEFLDASSELDRLAHRKPWQTSITDAAFYAPPSWARPEHDWKGAAKIAEAVATLADSEDAWYADAHIAGHRRDHHRGDHGWRLSQTRTMNRHDAAAVCSE